MASKSDVWLSTWHGSEPVILLAIANYLIQNNLYDKDFVEKWVNWEETLEFFVEKGDQMADSDDLKCLETKLQQSQEREG